LSERKYNMSNQYGQQPQWPSQQPQYDSQSFNQPQWGQPQQMLNNGGPVPPYTPVPPQTPPNQYYAPAPVQPPPKKKGVPKWAIGLLVGAVVIVALCSIVSLAASKGGSTASVTTPGAPATGKQPTDNQPTPPADTGNVVAKVGQAITVDQVACTVTSAQVLQKDEYIAPKQGQQFIVVHVKLANNGTSEQSYNPFDFHARSSSGNITETEIAVPTTYTANNQIQSGKLAPGGKVEGDIVFQIPVGDAKAQMTWSPSFFNTSSQYAWVLGVQ
jgi:Domain of unknown function (DUF4352)